MPQLVTPWNPGSPGHDGYCTPTVEVIERTFDVLESGESSGCGGTETLAPVPVVTRQRAPLQASETEVPRNGKLCETLSRPRDASSASNLEWKRRIRYFTWAYFTRDLDQDEVGPDSTDEELKLSAVLLMRLL